MPQDEPSNDSQPLGGVAALGIAAFAVACCAALPLLAALAGSVAVGTVLGVGAGLAAAALLGGLVVARARPRRAGEPRDTASGQREDGAAARPRA